MARKTSTTSSQPTTSITLSQQANNALRQMINAIGWAKTIEDITYGGQLLSSALPELDPVDWVKTVEEQKAFSADERKAYIEQDAVWGAKTVTFPLSTIQQTTAVKAFRHWVTEAAAKDQLAPAGWLTELIEAFGITDSD